MTWMTKKWNSWTFLKITRNCTHEQEYQWNTCRILQIHRYPLMIPGETFHVTKRTHRTLFQSVGAIFIKIFNLWVDSRTWTAMILKVTMVYNMMLVLMQTSMKKTHSQWFFEEVKLKVSNIALSIATMNL